MYDLFICHASEDKDFVRPLVKELNSSKNGLKVWYDEFELKVGDSLRKKIEGGLKNSRAGVLVLSPDFLKGKKWTEHELSALDALEKGNRSRILPVWHNIAYEELLEFSPMLADRFAVNSKIGPMSVAAALKRAIEPIRGTILETPSYEDSHHRFLSGEGELIVGRGGPACNIFEAVIHFKEDEYPLILGNQPITRKDLLWAVGMMLSEYPETGVIPELYRRGITSENKDALWQIMKKELKLERPKDI